jgi:hypothetical protein
MTSSPGVVGTRKWPAWVLTGLLLAGLAAPARAVSNDELKRYGFGDGVTDAIDQSRQLEPPKPEPMRRVIPEPVVPGLSDTREIPRPTGFENRTLDQAYPRRAPPFEGPTDAVRGRQARREERGFAEVEDFVFAPRQVFPRFYTLADRGLTGLGRTITAEVAPKNTIQTRSGVDYLVYKRAYGQPLLPDQKIEQWQFPFAYSFTPTNDLELSLDFAIFDERGRDFPLVQNYTAFGLADVMALTKYRFYNNPGSRVSLAVSLGMRNGVKSNVTRIGSSGVDYMGSVSATKRIRNFGIHGEGGAWFVNGVDRTNSGVPDVTFWNLGADLQVSENLDVVLELNGFDWQSSGNNIDASTGFKLRLNHNWILDLNGAVNLHSTIPVGYRSHIYGGLQWQF